jgi:dUTP pyrophosphatase
MTVIASDWIAVPPATPEPARPPAYEPIPGIRPDREHFTGAELAVLDDSIPGFPYNRVAKHLGIGLAISEASARPVPHAESSDRATARLSAMTPSERRQTFIDAGILTSDGALAEPYGGIRPSGPTVQFKRLHPDAKLPERMTPGSAGLDLFAYPAPHITVRFGEIVRIKTGIAAAIPAGYEGQVRPRSGLASKHGITVLNSPGTIDSDYRGEILVILINHGTQPVTINHGDRIAQLVICPVATPEIVEVDELPGSERGTGGFGSTGR